MTNFFLTEPDNFDIVGPKAVDFAEGINGLKACNKERVVPSLGIIAVCHSQDITSNAPVWMEE